MLSLNHIQIKILTLVMDKNGVLDVDKPWRSMEADRIDKTTSNQIVRKYEVLPLDGLWVIKLCD